MKATDAEALMTDLAKVGETMRVLVEVLERGDREAESTREKLATAVEPIRAVADVLEGFAGAVLSVQTRGGTYDGRAVVKVADGLRALAGLLDEPRWEDPAWHERLDASIPTAIEGREVVEALSNIDLVPVEALAPGPEDSMTPSAVEDLLANPPISKADCLRRLRDVDLEDVRKELLRRTTMTMMTEERCQAAADVLRAIGPGGAVDELERMVSSTKLPVPLRYWALNVLKRGWPTRGERVFGELPDGGVRLYLHGLGVAVEMVPDSPRQGVILMERIAGDDRYREPLFANVERSRVQLGVPALALYGLAVESGNAREVEPQMLSAIAAEPGPVAARWVAALRDGAEEPERRRALGKAVSAVRRARLSGRARRRRHTHDGVAYIGSGEGGPDITLVAVFAEADGAATSVLAILDAEDRLEAARAWRSRSYAEALERPGKLDRISADKDAKVSLADAAALMVQALRHGLPEDPRTRSALVYFDRAYDPSVEVPRLEPATEAPEDEVRRLLQTPEYKSWRYAHEIAGPFDDKRLQLRPMRRGSLDAYHRARLVPAAHKMARFHAYRGEHDLGRLILAAAREAERSGTQSALVRAMEELPAEGRSVVEALVAPSLDAPDEPETRKSIKQRLFASLEEPRGRDLLLLDLTSRLACCKGNLWTAAIGGCRGLPEDFDKLAHEIVRRFLAHLDPGEPLDVVAVDNDATTVVRRATGLPHDQASRLAHLAVATLAAFVTKLCPVCPVRCLDDLDGDAGDAFFGTVHPLSWPKKVH